MSKICSKCGSIIPESSKFCSNCGTAAPPDAPAPAEDSKFCRNCGSPLNPGTAFCSKCGSPTNTAPQTPPPVQQTYVPPVQPQYQQPVQPTPPPPVQQQPYVPPMQPQYQQPVQQAQFVQPSGRTAVKAKKSKYPIIITVVAVFLAITLVVTLIFNPFGKKSALGEELEASFSKLCDMTTLGTESYALARLLTEQLLETDLASADPDSIDGLFDQCLDAWKATEEVSNRMISMSDELGKNEKIKSTKGISTKISATYAPPELVDILFPFTIRSWAANEGDISTEVSEAASPADSVGQCSKLGVQILSDSRSGYSVVADLRDIYHGRTTPVQDWNNAVNNMANHFGMRFYISGEITSGAFTTIPNGTHSVHTLSNTVKGGTIGVGNTDILVDVSDNGGCIVFGTTSGLTINQDQFPDYQPGDGSRTISINTYPETPNENSITFHATSFFSWFKLDRVGGFHITRGNKGEGSVTDPPTVRNTGGNPPEGGRGVITDYLPPVDPGTIRDTSNEITNRGGNNGSNGNNSGNNGNTGNTGNTGNNSQPPITGNIIDGVARDNSAGVGPITVTLGWQTRDDLDLHMITPDGSRIYFRNKTAQGGTLDVDMNVRESEIQIPAIENIYFPDPENGHYKIYLRDYRDRTDDYATHWMIKVKIGDTEKIFEGDINTGGTEQFVYEFDYNQHGTGSTLPGEPTVTELVDNVVSRGGRTGKITVSTMWNRYDDVDVHVLAPGSAHIYYSNKTAGGGVLDVDANAGGQRILDPVENVCFENPKNGHYKVYLNEYADRSDDSASYLVRIDIDGEVHEFRGTIDTTGTDVPIYEFDYNGADETPTGTCNGHRYEYYPNADISWTEARSMAQSIGGHLVTITSAEEQEFIETTFPGTTGWIGAYGDNNGWSWVTGETFGGYSKWKSGEPNDQGGIEWCGHLWTDMTWNDLDNEDISGYQTGFYVEFDEYGDGTGYVPPTGGNNGNNGNNGNGNDTSGSGGYWKLTKMTPYVYDGVNGRYVEGTSSHYENGDDMYEIDWSENGTNGVLTYNNPYYTNMYHEFIGTGKASATFTLPKTAYAAEETAEVSFSMNASDTDKGYAFLDMQVDLWTGTHTKDDLSLTQGTRFNDEAQGKYSFEVGSPNYNSGSEKASLSAHVTRAFPSAPRDLTDNKQTVVNIRIDSFSKGTLVYTYEWTGGSMPANVGAATGYITGGSTGNNDNNGNNGNNHDGLTGTYNGHTYMVIEQEVYPGEADDYCRSQGGYLATITSQGEQDFVAGLAARSDYSNFWIGGSDYGSEGNWYWLNGEAWGYTAWYPGGSAGDPEPNNGLGAGEDYAFMNKERDYQWVDGYGGYSYSKAYFICEWGDYESGGTTGGNINDVRDQRGAGDGKITISLMWDSEDDLDLHIFTPDESELWWGNPSAQGGTFDLDANRAGNMKDPPLENAYFPNPVSGDYWVYVYNYEDRTPNKSTNWTVRVQVGDEEEIFSGTIAEEEDTIEVLGFSYTAAVG